MQITLSLRAVQGGITPCWIVLKKNHANTIQVFNLFLEIYQ